MTDPVIVIPARWASSRFPGKPLANIAGRSLLSRTIEAGRAVAGVARLIVATDDDRIAREAEAAGAEVAMTDRGARNGTERVAEAVAAMAAPPGIVVNLQGDAPLTPPWFVEAIVAGLNADPEAAMATPILRCDAAHLARLRADRAAGRAGATTVVADARGRALYFSREVLPSAGDTSAPVFHHVGVYAYRPGALLAYPGLAPSPAEEAEGLEQLRFLHHGFPVACVEVEARGRAFWEVNHPEDVARVEAILAREVPA